MCGICGELRFDGARPEARHIKTMLGVLAPRGPDNEGEYFDGPLALGHRRLSIIDLSAAGNQPMHDPGSGLTLVFNGTIYNYPLLRDELKAKGHAFNSHSDTEVILKAWAEWGQHSVERLHGMFAFVIWDGRRQQLFMARDRMGIKPLYYSLTRERLLFASSPQALLAVGGVDTTIDSVALHHHFSLHAVVPAPRTLLKGIRKMIPATTMKVGMDGHHEVRTYWHLKAVRPEKAMSEWEWTQAIHDALQAAVEKRKLIADVPVGVLLSGGLDSSLLVALLAEAGVEDLKTFSVGFEDKPEEKGSEFEFSDQVVDRYRTDHHKFVIPNSEVLKRLPDAVRSMAEPMVAQDAVAFYLLSEQVSRQVKVVQSGQGADEVFGGYFWYPRMQAASGTPAERFSQHYFDRDHGEYCDMVASDYCSIDYTSALVEERLKRVDNMTMAWGLEARVPFLDHELVELAAQMPPELKLRSEGKHILKSIARGRIPDAVIDRPKGYFPVPALKYVEGEFLAFMREILSTDRCRQRGLYNPAYVDKMLAEPEKHFTRIQGSKLWHLALLEYWLQMHVG